MKTTYFYSAGLNTVCRATTRVAADKFFRLVWRTSCLYVPIAPAEAKRLIKEGAAFHKIKDLM